MTKHIEPKTANQGTALRCCGRLPQRQTLARCADGVAMDYNRNAGSREKLPSFEGPQAASRSEGCVAAPSASAAR
jgi:hypothetical protein